MNLAETRTHSPILNKKKEKKGRKPIKKVSKVRTALNREYMRLRAIYLKDNPYCDWWLAEHSITQDDVSASGVVFNHRPGEGLCPLQSTEVHHVKGRGKYMLDTSTWMAVSAEGHRRIHAAPATSYATGYMQPRR